MIHFPCACGRQLQARAADIGRLASCPLCGQTTTVPDRDQPRPLVYPRDQQTQTPPAVPVVPTPAPPGRVPSLARPTSDLASLSVVCGVLSIFAGLTSIPAIVLAILALRRIARSEGQLGGKGNAIAGLVLGGLGLLWVPGLYYGVQRVRVQAARMTNASRLKQMACAFHNYHSANGSFPGATAFYTKEGKPGLSWRVALLPFIEQDSLFKEFRLDEPWDSPHNIKLLPRMPTMYLLHSREHDDSGLTHYQVFVGPDTPFGLAQGKRDRVPGVVEEGPRLPASFPGGTANTILIATARDPVPWTKPVDLPYDPKKPLPPLGRHYGAGLNAAFADGSARWIDETISERNLRKAITSTFGQLEGSDW
jgi:prepilin-type processing-associated H-X9-DG protein